MLTIMKRHAHSWEPACLGLSPSSTASSSVSLGTFYEHSVPWFPHLKTRNNNGARDHASNTPEMLGPHHVLLRGLLVGGETWGGETWLRDQCCMPAGSHTVTLQVWGEERRGYRVLVQPETGTGPRWGQGQGA